MKTLRFILKGIIYCAVGSLMAVSIWWLFFSVDGTKAYINGSLSSVNAPIDGTISLVRLSPTDSVYEGMSLGAVTNPRAAQLELDYNRLRSDHLQLSLKEETMKAALSERQALLEDTLLRVASETKLNVELVEGDMERARQELKGLEASARVANDKWRRVSDPRVRTALSQNELVEAQGLADTANALVTAKKAELTAHKSRLQAAMGGWDAQLRQRTQSFSEKIKLEREIKDLTRDIAETKLRGEQLAVQVKQAEEQLGLARAAGLVSQINGCVWSIERRDGSVARAADTVLQILSPDDRWVEAFVPESQASRLGIGETAIVSVAGTKERFPATIEAIRSGGGRIATGQDVAYPPPERMRKEVAVRLRFSQDKAPQFSSRDFYGVGKTVSVEFSGSGSLSGFIQLVMDNAESRLGQVLPAVASTAESFSLPKVASGSSLLPVFYLVAGMFGGMLLSVVFRRAPAVVSVCGGAGVVSLSNSESLAAMKQPVKDSEVRIYYPSDRLSLPERHFQRPVHDAGTVGAGEAFCARPLDNKAPLRKAKSKRKLKGKSRRKSH